MRQCVANELLFVVAVAAVPLDRSALVLALGDNKIGQKLEFAQISDDVR